MEPINLEKKPPALVGCNWADAGLIATVAAEDNEELEAREVADGLCTRPLGRDGDGATSCGLEEEGIISVETSS